MVRLFLKIAIWLDSRFPAKIVIKEADYKALKAKVEALEANVEAMKQVAVHKDAVRDVIEVVQKVKEDLQSFKTSLGFNRMQTTDILASLNGEPIGSDTNG